MRAGLAASTVTPGITAPDVSFTAPAMLPLSWVWPEVTSGKSTRHDAIATHAILRALIAVAPRSLLRLRTAAIRLLRGILRRASGPVNSFCDDFVLSRGALHPLADGLVERI